MWCAQIVLLTSLHTTPPVFLVLRACTTHCPFHAYFVTPSRGFLPVLHPVQHHGFLHSQHTSLCTKGGSGTADADSSNCSSTSICGSTTGQQVRRMAAGRALVVLGASAHVQSFRHFDGRAVSHPTVHTRCRDKANVKKRLATVSVDLQTFDTSFTVLCYI